MQPKDFIDARNFCSCHNVDVSFLKSLQEFELVELNELDEILFFPSRQLPELEKIIRFHYDLEINLQGIEAITHLLRKIETLQQENLKLKNKLRLLEI